MQSSVVLAFRTESYFSKIIYNDSSDILLRHTLRFYSANMAAVSSIKKL